MDPRNLSRCFPIPVPQTDSFYPQVLRFAVIRNGLDTTVVSEARSSGAGAEDEEYKVVGEIGEGEDEKRTNEQGEGGGVEQQVGEPGQAPSKPTTECSESSAPLPDGRASLATVVHS